MHFSLSISSAAWNVNSNADGGDKPPLMMYDMQRHAAMMVYTVKILTAKTLLFNKKLQILDVFT